MTFAFEARRIGLLPVATAITAIKSRTFGTGTVKMTFWIQIETTNVFSQVYDSTVMFVY